MPNIIPFQTPSQTDTQNWWPRTVSSDPGRMPCLACICGVKPHDPKAQSHSFSIIHHNPNHNYNRHQHQQHKNQDEDNDKKNKEKIICFFSQTGSSESSHTLRECVLPRIQDNKLTEKSHVASLCKDKRKKMQQKTKQSIAGFLLLPTQTMH